MNIEAKRIVTLSYTLHENNAQGRIMETMDPHYPFTFFYGTGQLLPAFEEALLGLKEGDSFEISLNPEQAYGEPREEDIIEVPNSVFESEGVLQED